MDYEINNDRELETASIIACFYITDLTDKLDEIEIAKEFISVNSERMVCFNSNPLLCNPCPSHF